MSSDGKSVKTVVVFCGSKNGNNPVYRQDAARLGALLGQNGFDLVYGGGTAGLMGAVAESALQNGSRVTGIITHEFRNASWYRLLPGAEEFVANSLQKRKIRMITKADAIVVLPGGIGTLDEQWEAAALLDMKMCGGSPETVRPIIVLNTNGYYDHQKAQMKKAVAEGFIYPGRERIIQAVDTPEAVIGKLNEWNQRGRPRVCDLMPPPPPSP